MRIRAVPVAEAEAAQQRYSGWNRWHKADLGRVGVVDGVYSGGYVRVRMNETGSICCWNRNLVEPYIAPDLVVRQHGPGVWGGRPGGRGGAKWGRRGGGGGGGAVKARQAGRSRGL